MTTQQQHVPGMSIDAATEIGVVSLRVADLERSARFYTEAIGFSIIVRDDAGAILGVGGAPLLVLREQRGARPWPGRATGLYHFAVLLPSRRGLGQWLRHWLSQGYGMPGQGDHLVSEALYLSDPDGNGIEMYRDRPREEWTWEQGQVRMASNPVDVRGLVAEAEASGEPWTGLEVGTRVGHIHLQVGSIEEAGRFYHDVLGFDVVAGMPSALFVSAGGYHHHIGLNTWHSQGAGPAPDGTAGLRCFTLAFRDEAARAAVVDRVRASGATVVEEGDRITVLDPWTNRIVLHVGPVVDAQRAAALS